MKLFMISLARVISHHSTSSLFPGTWTSLGNCSTNIYTSDEVTVEDVDDDDNEDDDAYETDSREETEAEHESSGQVGILAHNSLQVGNIGTGNVVSNQDNRKSEGTPGFTFYVNRRLTSMPGMHHREE
ncbi:hypothetical protein L1887_12685 [Cichorium endivia]|nr:hypothetical protein L1887_12685 [Cichorium endivia]